MRICELCCVYKCMCVCVCMHVHTCVYVCTRVHVYMYVLCMYVCIHMYLCVHVSMCVCCVLQRCRSDCTIQTSNRRPRSDPGSCLQSANTPGDSKTDKRDDSEIHTGLCSATRRRFEPETISFHVSIYFVLFEFIIIHECLFICLF